MTAKLIKCNINNKHGPFSAEERVPECKRTEKNKREAKQQKETAFILDQTITICQTQQLL